MQKFIVLLVSVFCVSAWTAEQIRYSRRALPRANEIRFDDIRLSVDRDESSPSYWAVHASKGKMFRRAAVIPDGVNRLWFPGLLVEIRNWNLARRESWSIMAETIGDFEVRTRSLEDINRTGKISLQEKTADGRKKLFYSNGLLTVSALPEYNGLMPDLIHSLSGKNLFYATAVKSGLSLKTFQHVGFIEIFDSFGKTPEVDFSWKMDGDILQMQGRSGSRKGVLFHRSMAWTPGGYALTIRNSAEGEKGREELLIKHRPEFRMPDYQPMQAVRICWPDARGRLSPSVPEPGTALETALNAYAVTDRFAGVLLGIQYRKQSQLYVWRDKNYFSAEATGYKISLQKKPELEVEYFLVHGMSEVDFINQRTVFALEEKNLSGLTGKDFPMTITFGSAEKLSRPEIRLSLWDGKKKMGPQMTVSAGKLAAGDSKVCKIICPAASLPAGSFNLEVGVYNLGKKLVSGRYNLRLVDQKDLEVFRKLMVQVQQRQAALRKDFRKSSDKRAVMRQFKKVSEFRKNLQTAIENSDMEKLRQLQKTWSQMI